MPPFLKPLTKFIPKPGTVPMPKVPTTFVEIRPVFKVKPGKHDEMNNFCKERFIEKMSTLTSEGRDGPGADSVPVIPTVPYDLEAWGCVNFSTQQYLVKGC